jgi:hypothetical protein
VPDGIDEREADRKRLGAAPAARFRTVQATAPPSVHKFHPIRRQQICLFEDAANNFAIAPIIAGAILAEKCKYAHFWPATRYLADGGAKLSTEF